MNNNFFIKISALILTILLNSNIWANELNIMSWNIANLAEPGAELRGVSRSNSDYDSIKQIISEQSADIIALQEIGSYKAARSILPPGYELYLEKRCLNPGDCVEAPNTVPTDPEDHDIYTGIAFLSSLIASNDAQVFYIEGLDIPHQNECPASPARKVRGAVGVSLKVDNQRVYIPSIHLKASCKRNDLEDEPDLEDDCETGREQMKILGTWAKNIVDNGDTYILAGDFNREFLQDTAGNRDKHLLAFENQSSRSLDVYPKNAGDRTCWNVAGVYDTTALENAAEDQIEQFEDQGVKPMFFEPKFSHEIDFFAFDNEHAMSFTIESKQIEMEDHYKIGDLSDFLITDCNGNIKKFGWAGGKSWVFAESLPSDHCPILLNVTIN